MTMMKAAAAFLGGILATLAVVGFTQLVDNDGDGSDDQSAMVATQSPSGDDTSDGDDSQASLSSGDCQSAADIYETVRPSVVEIDTSATGGQFFGQQVQGTGSGVVLDDEGYILTNNHVVDGAETIEVVFDDGGVAAAELIGTDPANDLAVIKVDPLDHDLTPADIGDSDELRVGDPVLALGTPFSLEGTLTQGIVSALDRVYSSGASDRPIRGMIQTDAAVNPGNSGGPLINCYGEVIGINTLLENPSGDSVNVGVAFAVAINTATNELDALKAGETVAHAWLGVAGQNVTPALAEELDLGVETGVYITLVTAGGPADDAGLEGAFLNEQQAQSAETAPIGGDVITEADGDPVTGIDQLAEYLANNKQPGDTVELTVIRDGDEITIEANLADWPS